MQITVEIPDEFGPQNIAELVNRGMVKAVYKDNGLRFELIKPEEEGIIGHIRAVPPEMFNRFIYDSDGFNDSFVERIFEKSTENFGILVPVIAIRNIDGYTVVDGRKRVLLAKKLGIKVPTIVRDYDETMAKVVHFIVNFARKVNYATDYCQLFKEVIAEGGSVLLRDAGMKTTEIFAVSHADENKEVIEKLKYRSNETRIEVAKISIRDKERAKDVAEIVLRKEIDDAEGVKKAEEEAKRFKEGFHCAVCGESLTRENVNWVVLCSACKYSLYEELKQVIIDKRIKCFVDGHRYYADEIVTISKENLKKLLLDIPEEKRLNNGWQRVWERINGDGIALAGNG